MNELYVGLMSGTSMDAIDAVLVDFSQGIRLKSTHTLPMPSDLRRRLGALCQSGPDEIERLGRADAELGALFAAAVNELLDKSQVDARQVKAIGSHGQTIRHRPLSQPPFTLQIGDPNVISEHSAITVIADFRRRDMAAGGQGAPLVPAFHADVFGSRQNHRIVLNLGGIANVTLLPAGQPEATSGFDTGPANTLMDAWSQLQRGETYDAGGKWAASGNASPMLLERLLAHPFFARPAPKSTGREDFNIEWLQAELNALRMTISSSDVQATLLELTALTVATAINGSSLDGGELLICGGGAFNDTLWRRLQVLLPNWDFHSTAEFGLAPTWVEATAFAWLARRTMLGLPGNLPAVTGATGPRILGAIYPA